MQKINCYFFYFDIIDVVDNYLKNQPVLEDLLQWQRAVRAFDVRGKINCITFADNVLARFKVNENNPIDCEVLQYAGKTMKEARRFGLKKFFGVITKGIHEFDLFDRSLSTSGDPTNILEQHLDTFSDPYLRAVLAEKWSGKLAKAEIHPGQNAVWVSEEVHGWLNGEKANVGQDRDFHDLGISFDLHDSKFNAVEKWPFTKSKFRLIG